MDRRHFLGASLSAAAVSGATADEKARTRPKSVYAMGSRREMLLDDFQFRIGGCDLRQKSLINENKIHRAAFQRLDQLILIAKTLTRQIQLLGQIGSIPIALRTKAVWVSDVSQGSHRGLALTRHQPLLPASRRGKRRPDELVRIVRGDKRRYQCRRRDREQD